MSLCLSGFYVVVFFFCLSFFSFSYLFVVDLIQGLLSVQEIENSYNRVAKCNSGTFYSILTKSGSD